MATFWRSNRVDAESTESDIQAGRSDEDGEKEDKAYGDECDKEKEQTVVSHDQADAGMDSEDEIAQQQQPKNLRQLGDFGELSAYDILTQELQIGEQHGYDTKKQSSTDGDNSSDISWTAKDDKSTDVSEDINGGMEKDIAIEGKEFNFQIAEKCIFIPQTRIVMFSNEASCLLDDWSRLVALKKMDATNSKFEIEVINKGETGQIAMGLYGISFGPGPPGWGFNSIGFHLNNGSIYIGHILEETKTNVTPAKGDKITMEIRIGKTERHESEERNLHLKINNNDIISGLPVGSDVYPGIAMSSKGAAVKLLNDTFWMVNESPYSLEYQTMSTVEKDGIMISPKEAISMSERSGRVYGLMSICNTSPNKQSIAFEVRYGKSDTSIVRDVLAYTQAWAERLCIHKDDLLEAITVEWTPIHNDDVTTYPTKENWTLEEICQTMKTERQSYTLKVSGEPKENKCDNMSKTTDAEEPMDNKNVLNIVRFAECTRDINSVIHRGRTSSENAGSLDEAQFYSNPVGALLKMLANVNDTDFKRDEDTMLKQCEKAYKSLHEDELEEFGLDFITRYDDGSGNTVLHFAATLGSKRLVDLLYNYFERIKYLTLVENVKGNLPLQLAITGKHDETAIALLKMMENSGFSIGDIFWNEGNKDSKKGIKLTIKELLESKMIETTKWVLDKFEDKKKEAYLVAPLELDKNKRCPTDDGYNHKDTTAYSMIFRDFVKELANHECVKSLSEYKWRKYGRRMFWVTFVLYLIFWGALTTAVVTGVTAEDATKYDKPVDYVRLLSEVAALCYAILTLVGEFFQYYGEGIKMYLSDGYNYVDVLSSILIIIVLPLRLLDSGGQWGCFAVGYIIWTFRSIKFLTVIREWELGQLGHIIIRLIVQDILKFALYFLVILFGFSGGLFLALKEDTNLNVHDETSTFWGILVVGVRVLVEAQPVLDYTGPEGYRTFSCVIMLTFLASTCIVMLNIFIAQLSSRFTEETRKVKEACDTRRFATMEIRDGSLWYSIFGQRHGVKDFKEYVDTYEKQCRSG